MAKSKEYLFGRFELLNSLGSGSTGEVYRVKEKIENRELALKILRPEVVDRIGLARFRRQFYLMAQLKDPRVVPVYETGYSDGKLWFTMQLLDGGTLEDISAPVPTKSAIEKLISIASGLEFIHAHGIFHLDLKPDNIFISDNGLMLADFGLTGTKSGGICGTPSYIAPEIIRQEHFDFRADLYSLGVIALELLTGENPFDAKTAAESIRRQLEFNPIIPKTGRELADFSEIIVRLLSKNPTERPPSAYSVRIALQDLIGLKKSPGENYFLPHGPFVDREKELSKILDSWKSLSGPIIISVCGESGMGVSALCERVFLDINAQGGISASVSGAEDPVVSLLTPYLGSEFRDILQEHLPGLLPSLDFSEDVAANLGIESSAPAENYNEFIARVVGAMEVLSARGPLFLRVSGEAGTNRLWEEIAKSEAAILILIEDRNGGNEIKLGPIPEKAIEDYISGIFGNIEKFGALTTEIFKRAKGNIGTVRNTLRNFISAGALIPEKYNWRFVTEAIPSEIPFNERWNTLSKGEKTFAAAVSLANPIGYEVLEAILGSNYFVSAYALTSKGLIREYSIGNELLYRPSGELTREIDKLISAKFRKETHIRIGEAYLRLGESPDNLYRSAYHLHEGEKTSRSFPLLYKAGTGFMKKNRYGDAERAFALAVKSIEYAPDAETSIKTAKRLGLSRKYLGDFEGAREAYYRAMAIAEQTDNPSQVASILGDIGVTFFESGDAERAIELYERAAKTHKEQKNEKNLLFDLVNIAGAYQVKRDFARARQTYKKASELADRLDHSLAKSAIGLNLGQMDIADGDFMGALPRILDAASISKEENYGQFFFQALLSLAEIYRCQGRTNLAEKALDEGNEIAVSIGKRACAAVDIERAALERTRGRIGDADAFLANAISAARSLGKDAAGKLAIETALLSCVTGRIIDLPDKLPQSIETEIAGDFKKTINGGVGSEEEIAVLERICDKASDLGYESLAVEAAIACHGYYKGKNDDDSSLSFLKKAEEHVSTSDPYPAARISEEWARYYADRGEIASARRSLSLAVDYYGKLDNRRAIENLEKIVEVLEEPNVENTGFQRLLPIIKALNSTLEVEDLLGKIIDATIEITCSERGLFFLTENGGAEIVLARSADGRDLPPVEIRFSHGLIDKVIAAGKASFSESVADDEEFSSRSSVIDLELTMALCVPVLSADGEIRGLIYTDSRIGRGKFDDTTLQLVSALADQAAVALRNAWRFDALRAERDRIAGEYSERFGSDIIGDSDAMARVRKRLAVIAPQDISVLITGDTGTGKELIARTIHFESPRHDKNFIAVNCAALPENLLESELFGHEKGSFTGAERQHIGRFEQADAGTLFLDEIGEMPIGLQAKLLRVIESRTITRIGGTGEIAIDVRIITATNRDPETAIADGVLRQDLYYRIAPVRIHLPPLTSRPDDIPALAAHFLTEANTKYSRDIESISRRALALLSNYRWPGNVRELSATIEEAVLFASGNNIRAEDLPTRLTEFTAENIALGDIPGSWDELKERKAELVGTIEEQVLRRVLEINNWNVTRAAKSFGMNRSHLHQLMSKYGIVSKK